jgi:hypothetical protein
MQSKILATFGVACLAGCAVKPEKLCAEFAPDTWSYLGADAALDQQFASQLPGVPAEVRHYWYRSGENQVMACTLPRQARDQCSMNVNVFQRMDGDWQPGYSDGVLCNVTAADPALAAKAANQEDAEMLLRLHQEVMDAHRQLSVDMLLRNESADYVVAGRGKVTRPTLEERRERLGSYFRSTRFTEYVDVIAPMAMVSLDGSLGWVVVQVRAKGQQEVAPGKTEPLEFESAWIELYRRGPKGWQRIGNVSNFRE